MESRIIINSVVSSKEEAEQNIKSLMLLKVEKSDLSVALKQNTEKVETIEKSLKEFLLKNKDSEDKAIKKSDTKTVFDLGSAKLELTKQGYKYNQEGSTLQAFLAANYPAYVEKTFIPSCYETKTLWSEFKKITEEKDGVLFVKGTETKVEGITLETQEDKFAIKF